jgi:hypothetical protein
MKTFLSLFAILFVAQASYADVDSCVDAAEQAAWDAWYKPGDFTVGDIQNGATDVVWVRGGVISYQVSIQYRKLDSTTMNYANYSVRVRESDCAVLKVRKF